MFVQTPARIEKKKTSLFRNNTFLMNTECIHIQNLQPIINHKQITCNVNYLNDCLVGFYLRSREIRENQCQTLSDCIIAYVKTLSIIFLSHVNLGSLDFY